MLVAEVVVKLTVAVLPYIAVGDIKFGAAIYYPQIIAIIIELPPVAPLPAGP
jgi:hypothetical protein